MVFKNWPIWLKGGFIGAVIYLALIPVTTIVVFFFYLFIPVTILIAISGCKNSFCAVPLMIVFSVAIGFIIGAIIGLIVGVFRK